MNNKCCVVIFRSNRLIKQHKILTMEIVYKRGRRINYERGSTNNKGVCSRNCINRTTDYVVVKAFFVKDYVWFYKLAAFCTAG